ncbi:BTAD domain-containing putative transcriptional regulator [Streptomyces sp. NPDC051940]|uniref:ATP-binding protein n=1 Tax=Streptomyces sp. NPDC051940 TaxID=3155675 RepID=UPI00342E1884
MTIQLRLLTGVSFRGQEITAPRLRGLLALLGGELRAGCGTGALVDGLWPDEQPENPVRALRILVSRLRAQLGADVVEATPSGYRLTLGADEVDSAALLLHAEASDRRAHEGDHAAALREAEQGLELWDGGGAGGDELYDPVAALRAERISARGALVRAHALALARTGRRAEAAGPLAELAAELPRDEEVLAELLRCEAAAKGPAAALARYDAYRRRLRDELGADPGPAVRAVHQELLRPETPAIRQGVPHEPNPLLGREEDLAAVIGLLNTARVVSIVGPGGLGKTRLAYAVARAAEQRVVHVVPLASVTSDDDVAAEVASVLGVSENRQLAGMDHVSAIAAALGGQGALLVLDNCEQVLRGAADLVQALVSATRELRVLTTSRSPLDLSSESVYRLPELSASTAAELFAQRARAARPGIELPEDAVRELCAHLDGLPLAVELAAARVRVMSVAEVSRRLRDRFALLRGGSRDAPQRHRTLHAVVDWSWSMLDDDGRRAMRRLAFFPGGFGADAAEHVLADSGIPDVLLVLEQLAGQSLLQVADTPAGVRFRMLETVREFSAVQRAETGEDLPAQVRFLAWARDFGAAYHDALFGPDPAPALTLIRADQDNLAHALRLAIAGDERATVAAVSGVLAALWTVESDFSRMVGLVRDTAWPLSHYRPDDELTEATRSAAALCTATLFNVRGPLASRHLLALRRLPAAPPDTPLRAMAVVLVQLSAGQDDSVLDELCASTDRLVAGIANGAATFYWQSRNDMDRALKTAQRTLEAFEGGRFPWLLGIAHARMSELCMLLERGDEAQRHLLASLRILDDIGFGADEIGIRWAMVLTSLQLGEIDQAEYWLEQARSLPQTDEALAALVPDLGAQAEIHLARGSVAAGLGLWREAVRRVEEPGVDLAELRAHLEPWALELRAAAVIAHAQHGRLDLVPELVEALPGALEGTLAPGVRPPSVMDLPVCGALLLAVAFTDLAAAPDGTAPADAAVRTRAARMIALAERLRFLHSFQPTMSSARAREAARDADGPAYEEALSSYAGLDMEVLRGSALELLRERG